MAEEDEEGRAVTSSGGWEAVSVSGSDSTTGESLPSADEKPDPEAAALAAVPEGEYYAQLYADYVAAKRSLGEDASGVPQARFVDRIRGNADHLATKHGARMVRFRVETIGGQVNLKPVVIH